MSDQNESNPLRKPGIWSNLLVLSLMSGLLFQQRATLWAQGSAAKPAPDVIVFTNGDQLTGTLERATGDSFIFKSDVAGEITVSADKVKELRTGGKFVALSKNEKITRRAKHPGTITYSDNAITVADTSSGAPEVVPVKNLAYLVDDATYSKEITGNPGIWYGWNGTIAGGVTLVESTQTGQSYNAAVNLVRLVPGVDFLPPRTRSTINILETYGKISQPAIPETIPPTLASVTKTNIFHADAEHDKYLTPALYGLVGTSFDHNFSQGLNLQQIYGLGLGWTIIKTPVQQFDVKADVHYERQNFQPPTESTDLIGSSFTELYHRDLPAKIVFTESGTFIPAWNDFSAYSAIFAAGVQLPTYRRFSLNLNLLDNYLNNPAVGFKSNSLQFVTAISYTLK
ncbi:MAG TPA: DUF481 domain-containing protein [Edaphobacter sp.]|jgi:hypothetical protein|nr:DUF481 domain-containing protein [Edaphobacter sp.]